MIKKFALLFIIILIIIAGAFMLTKTNNNSIKVDTLPTNLRNGTWDWDSPANIDESKFQDQIAFAKSKNIKVIYLFIEDAISTKDINGFNTKAEKLISIANQSGIEVDALAGDTDWAEGTNVAIPQKLLNYVLNFNNKFTSKFSGIQFDIEFYNQKNFTKDKETHIRNYLSLVQKLSNVVKNSNESNFKLGFAVSHSLDTGKGLIPKVDFNANTETVMEHLLDILQSTPSYLVIMAYRNIALGNNGTIDIAGGEIKLADQKAGKTEIYVGQETEKNEDKNITFYGMSQNELNKNASEIAHAFESSKSFKGISIHTLKGFEALSN